MPTLRTVLDESSRKEFETPPVFNLKQRKFFFSFQDWEKELLKSFSTPTNQVGFLLQLGYFRATGRFFPVQVFRRVDIEYLCKRLKVPSQQVDIKTYPKSSRRRHESLILSKLGILPFQDEVKDLCQQEADHLVTRQMKLHLVFGSLANFIREHYFELPSYSVIVAMINKARDTFEQQLQQQLKEQLTSQHQKQLDELFEQYLPESTTLANAPFQLTKLKANPEVIKVKVIRENVADLGVLVRL